jgi:EmrB/QacA subfamily drug resistance transporter
MSGATSEQAEPIKVLPLVAMALAVFVIANDVTALSLALPDIERDFDIDVGTAQWVINAYALVFGVLIVTGGRLADMIGRRRIFFIGAAVFVVFSILGALAPSAILLIASRALMGIGGAMMWPAVLGMTFGLLPADKAGLAGGLILGAAGFGNAAGPLIGGALTSIDWRLILILNLPVAAIACLVVARSVKESRDENAPRRIDYAGVTTLTVGLFALLLALDLVTNVGWTDPRVLGLLAAVVVLLTAFAVAERHAGEAALVPRDVMANRGFAWACLAVLLMSASFFAALMYLPQFMQKILDFPPLQAGAGMLPMMGLFALSSAVAGPLYGRVGGKLVVCVGAVCIALGTFLISTIQADSEWISLAPGMAVLGTGIGLFYSSVTTAAVTALDPTRSSLAGGIVYMFQIAGGSIGLGLTTTVFTTASEDRLQSASPTSGLSEAEREAVQGRLVESESAAQVLADLPARAAAQVEDIVREAFAAGMQWGFRLVALFAVAGAVVSVLFVAGPPFRGRRSSHPAEGEAAAAPATRPEPASRA